MLDDLILGRLRIASKGRTRRGLNAELESLSADEQRAEGMYMIGQVATLRSQVDADRGAAREVDRGRGGAAAPRGSPRSSAPVAARPTRRPTSRSSASPACCPRRTRRASTGRTSSTRSTRSPRSRRTAGTGASTSTPTAPPRTRSIRSGAASSTTCRSTRCATACRRSRSTSVDPMQLLALEVARQTLDDAGYHEKAFDRERASVILGASGGTGDVGSQYGAALRAAALHGALPADVADRLPEWTEDSFAGILLNVTAGRIANRFDLGGVNFTVDAACASSLAAVYQGVTELAAGRSDIVVAGGVDTVQGPFGYLCFSKTQALSPRGRCSTFDATADGIVITEGIAMVALKRLADAERDGDRIYAVIKGVGGASDGRAKGLTAPLPAARCARCAAPTRWPASARRASACSRRTAPAPSPATAPSCRAPRELIGEAGVAPRQAAIGSVKTLIGHTKATAGIAGLIKAALALHHRVLPPHRDVDKPNAILARRPARSTCSTEPLPWLDAGRHAAPRRGQRLRLRRHQLPRRAGRVHAASSAQCRRTARPSAGRPSCCSGARPTRRALADAARRRCAPTLERHAGVGAARPGRQPGAAAGAPAARRSRSSRRTAPTCWLKLDLALAPPRAATPQPLPPGVHHGVRADGARQARGAVPRPGLAVPRHAARARAALPGLRRDADRGRRGAARAVRRSASARRRGSAASSSRAAPTTRTTRPARARR